jgi:hypothetical protein
MAQTELVEDKENWRNDLSKQIAEFLPGTKLQMKSKLDKAELGESFKIWTLDTKRLLQGNEADSLEDLAHDTNRWHHQVFLNDTAQACAESRIVDNKAQVYQLSLSPLAAKIESAIDLLDNAPDQVRFLTASPLLLFAFWLVESRKVYLLDASESFSRLKSHRERVFPEVDFINLLREDLQSIKLK